VAIAEAAWAATLPGMRAGVSEAEVASELTVALLRAGSEPELPFFPIVATGPNGAQPHAVPSERRLAPGDLVIVDWGARYEGYCSDLTRTVAVAGAPVPPRLAEAYQAVVAANLAGRAAVRAGVTGAAVDSAARAAIEAAGLGPYFVHRTGHGLGLECHEEPNINAGEKLPLPVGAVFTVEPGVYLPGVGGVRIEDDVAVTAGGGETLTTLGRDLVVVG
jgi:Xaa-Pro dipeptidase